MKELSIEEKAKAYDKALEKAKTLKEISTNTEVVGYMDELFPELKESEDERVRRELLAVINDLVLPDDQQSRFVAWLEKQGKQTSEEVNEKPSDNTNNVESEFKIGDWVVRKDGKDFFYVDRRVAKITKLDGSGGLLLCQVDGDVCDKAINIRHWTIEDARNGDVLAASDSSIFIFAGMTNGCCKYHAVLTTTDGRILVNKDKKKDHYWETTKGARPATREQRDLLFQKMEKEGYRWNSFDKKVVKL